MRRRRGLDLGCGIGATTWGYFTAGFDMTGVDIAPQPNFPAALRFVQADAMEYLAEHGCEYDFIALSPPCQRYSKMSRCRPGLAYTYPDLIPPWRQAVQATGLPYIIENVEGAPLHDPVMLCTSWFKRETYRHRLFESNTPLTAPRAACAPRSHTVRASKAGHWEPGTYISIAGHCSPMWKAREAMGIYWCTREELVEAVPPVFTRYLGRQLMDYLEEEAA